MEYIEHGDLGQYISEYPAKAKSEAKAVILQILEGLEVLHERGICHRDLKPQVRQQSRETWPCKSLADRFMLLIEHLDCFSLPNLG